METPTKLYRCRESLWYGEFDNEIVYDEYRIIKETPAGFWIRENYTDKKWVSKSSRKRFAYPTKKEALNNFLHRKMRQVWILRRQLRKAEDYLTLANKQINE